MCSRPCFCTTHRQEARSDGEVKSAPVCSAAVHSSNGIVGTGSDLQRCNVVEGLSCNFMCLLDVQLQQIAACCAVHVVRDIGTTHAWSCVRLHAQTCSPQAWMRQAQIPAWRYDDMRRFCRRRSGSHLRRERTPVSTRLVTNAKVLSHLRPDKTAAKHVDVADLSEREKTRQQLCRLLIKFYRICWCVLSWSTAGSMPP